MNKEQIIKESKQKLRNTIRDINRRINRIAQAYGTESIIYKENVKILETNFKDWSYKNERGELQLSQRIVNSEYFNYGQDWKKMQLIGGFGNNKGSLRANVKTMTETTEKAEKELQNQGINDYTKEDLYETAENIEDIDSLFEKFISNYYDYDKYFEMIKDLSDEFGTLPKDVLDKMDKAYDILKNKNDKGQYSRSDIKDFNNTMLQIKAQYKVIKEEFDRKVKENADRYKRK